MKSIIYKSFTKVLLLLVLVHGMAWSDITGLLIPFNEYPTDTAIQPLINAKANNPDVPIRVILNPASGIGLSNDQVYAQAVSKLQAAGIEVVGYIFTDYNIRSSTDVKKLILTYKNVFKVDGIFFDAMGGKLSYYQPLTAYAKSIGLKFVIGNPGGNVDTSYAGVVDTVVVSAASYVPEVSDFTNWENADLPKSKIALILNDISALPEEFIAQAQNFAGWVYVTDLGGMGAWESLPSYFTQLVAALNNPHGGVLFPFYIYPTQAALQPAIAAKQQYPNVAMRLVLNPNSGPGAAINNDYVNAVQKLKAAGISVAGYVDTNYNKIPLATVEAEIAQWWNWYKPDGIFLDQMSLNHPYYSALTAYAKSLGIKYVIGNAGATLDVSAGNDVDTVVISENFLLPDISQAAYQNWFKAYPPTKLGLLAYRIPNLPTTFIQSAAKEIGWIYITDDGVNNTNPWDQYPSYWSDFVRLLSTL